MGYSRIEYFVAPLCHGLVTVANLDMEAEKNLRKKPDSLNAMRLRVDVEKGGWYVGATNPKDAGFCSSRSNGVSFQAASC